MKKFSALFLSFTLAALPAGAIEADFGLGNMEASAPVPFSQNPQTDIPSCSLSDRARIGIGDHWTVRPRGSLKDPAVILNWRMEFPRPAKKRAANDCAAIRF